jgi:hypothetical protein
MWQVAVVTYFRLLARYLPGGVEISITKPEFETGSSKHEGEMQPTRPQGLVKRIQPEPFFLTEWISGIFP